MSTRPDRMQFAGVHYLSDHTAGTGFFRHSATGMRRSMPIAWPTIVAISTPNSPQPARRVRHGDQDHFAAIGAIEARPDRLILYRAALLHSGLIAALPPHADDPLRGRLTGNLFLQCRTTA